ncbi:restriction endonuclease subunit S, partial [Persephonella sp.]|uniref:restriction endonuclease subunit S n=1 Tax=Persephonella sp. TaxID=2060922 RepID=UPI0025FE83B9
MKVKITNVDKNQPKNLPEGWKRVRLGDYINIETGLRPKGGAISSGIPSVGGEHISENGSIIFHKYNEKYIPFDFFFKMKKGHARLFDILINKDGANTGKVGLLRHLPFKYTAINEHVFIIRAKKGLHQIFLFYWLFSRLGQEQIKPLISGSAQAGLSYSSIYNLFLNLPPLPEQQKIAEILETVDNVIEKTDKIIEKYKRIKQGLMQDLLTKGIDENGNIRNPKTHKFKNSPLGKIPEEWEVVRLGEVAELERGKFQHRPRNDPKL